MTTKHPTDAMEMPGAAKIEALVITDCFGKPPPTESLRIKYFNAAQLRAERIKAYDLALEDAAKEFDRRNNGIGFYDPHEPAEIIRSLKS